MSWRWIDRALWALVGLAWFLWLGIEDRSTTIVVLLAALLGLRMLMTAWFRWITEVNRWRAQAVRASLAGALVGAAVPALASVLMLVKVSLHSHSQPDFSLADIQAVLTRAPIWALVGLLVGSALGLISPNGKDTHIAPPFPVEYNEASMDDSEG